MGVEGSLGLELTGPDRLHVLELILPVQPVRAGETLRRVPLVCSDTAACVFVGWYGLWGLCRGLKASHHRAKRGSFAARARRTPAINHVSKASAKGSRRVQVDFGVRKNPSWAGNFGILRKLRAAVLLWSPAIGYLECRNHARSTRRPTSRVATSELENWKALSTGTETASRARKNKQWTAARTNR